MARHHAVAAGASATLVGLVFVGVSIQVARQPLDARARLLGAMAVINLLHPFWVSLAMLAPIPAAVTAAALLALAVIGLSVTIGIDRARPACRTTRPASWWPTGFVVPVVAEAILAVGAVAIPGSAAVSIDGVDRVDLPRNSQRTSPPSSG